MKQSYLLDKEFLRELDLSKDQEKFARIISLSFEENPIEEIQGKVTGGSVNVDGSSAVRRSCNLTMVASDVNINDIYWGLNTKFKVEIGIKNNINPDYPDIIWFPQGVFIITSFSTSLNANSYTINISGRDKMVLLNGELSGAVTSLTWDFGVQDFIEKDGTVTTVDIPIVNIIRDAVHEYAKEPYQNIIINDLDKLGIELLEYQGDIPMYLLVDTLTNECTNMSLDGEQECYIKANRNDDDLGLTTLNSEDIIYDNRIKLNESRKDATEITLISPEDDAYYEKKNGVKTDKIAARTYVIIKLEYGQTAGYRDTDLTYTDNNGNHKLTLSVGDTITTMLDKIKAMLGDYEYFYDLEGRFVFQRKKTYINTSFNTFITRGEDRYGESLAETSSTIYNFEDNYLVSSFQNSPNYTNVRNDFSLWGTKKSVEGKELAVHLRYAIDKKPTYYKNFNNEIFVTEDFDYEELLGEVRKKIANEYISSIEKFELENTDAYTFGLQRPIQNKNGSWSAGWWDIRDWYNYYIEVMGEAPRGTMKWYSYCNEKGCTPIYTLNKFKNKLGYKIDINDDNKAVWLIIKNNEKREIEVTHGNGIYGTEAEDQVYYESYFIEDENSVPQDINGILEKNHSYVVKDYPMSDCSGGEIYLGNISLEEFNRWKNFPLPNKDGEDGENFIDHFNMLYTKNSRGKIEHNVASYNASEVYYRFSYVSYAMIDEKTKTFKSKNFVRPYSGCDATHTYLYFLEKINEGNEVYFYRPDFSQVTNTQSYEELIANRIEEETETVVNNLGNRVFDWRELIYQMSKDYKAHHDEDNFLLTVANNNVIGDTHFYPKGLTGYEQYYVDLDGFWRQLYNPEEYTEYNLRTANTRLPEGQHFYVYGEHKVYIKDENNNYVLDNNGNKTYENVTEYYEKDDYEEGYKYYIKTCYAGYNDPYVYVAPDPNFTSQELKEWRIQESEKRRKASWTKDLENPEILNFWFDFLDTDAYMDRYATYTIGDRSKAVNDSNIKAIYFRETPTVIFGESKNSLDNIHGYTYINCPEFMQSLFKMSGQGKSAIEVLNEYLYNYSYCAETISITTVPIYYLEPNTRIFVRDDKTGIDGEYILNSFNVSLAYNGTMSMSAVKASERIY